MPEIAVQCNFHFHPSDKQRRRQDKARRASPSTASGHPPLLSPSRTFSNPVVNRPSPTSCAHPVKFYDPVRVCNEVTLASSAKPTNSSFSTLIAAYIPPHRRSLSGAPQVRFAGDVLACADRTANPGGDFDATTLSDDILAFGAEFARQDDELFAVNRAAVNEILNDDNLKKTAYILHDELHPLLASLQSELRVLASMQREAYYELKFSFEQEQRFHFGELRTQLHKLNEEIKRRPLVDASVANPGAHRSSRRTGEVPRLRQITAAPQPSMKELGIDNGNEVSELNIKTKSENEECLETLLFEHIENEDCLASLQFDTELPLAFVD